MAEPYCLAMLLCDGVHQDPSTGKFTILGVYDTFAATKYPAVVSLNVYFAITDGIGKCQLRLQMIDAEAEPISATDVEKIEGDIDGLIFNIGSDQEFASPFEVHEQVVGMQFQLPKHGLYLCELWANDKMLMTRRFIARLVEEPNK